MSIDDVLAEFDNDFCHVPKGTREAIKVFISQILLEYEQLQDENKVLNKKLEKLVDCLSDSNNDFCPPSPCIPENCSACDSSNRRSRWNKYLEDE